MTPRNRSLTIAAMFAAVLAGASIALWPRVPQPQAERPSLMLLTSLPLLFGEDFGLEQTGSPAAERLERDFALHPISVADAASLGKRRLLLMAHPRAQPAEALVELDQWVRGGGRLVLLADPKLDWPSSRPLGDRLRPPPWFADTGLLRHWGLSLDGPSPDGPAAIAVDGRTVAAASPGVLAARDRACTVAAKGFVARCTIGKGRAIVVADADFLNVEGAEAIDGPTDGNLDWLAGLVADAARD